MASAACSSSSLSSHSAVESDLDWADSACIIGVALLHARRIMGEMSLPALEIAEASADAIAACAPGAQAAGGGAEKKLPALLAAD